MSADDEFDRLREAKARVLARLHAIPGVHAVGVGPKITGGKFTTNLAIKVYLVEKKPLSKISPEHVVPREIGGFRTDVIEMDVPSLWSDEDKDRPLVGGIRIKAKNSSVRGTLSFFAHTVEAQPKLVAVTNEHVVAPVDVTKLSDLKAITPAGTPSPYKITFSGVNTPGSLVVIKMASASQNKKFTAYWATMETDTLSSIATSVVAAVNGISGANVTTAIGPHSEDVVITTNAGADTVVNECSVYDPVAPDPNSKLIATIAANAITFSGQTAGEYGIYTSWNTNGSDPTRGAFAAVIKNSTLADVATLIASSVNALSVAGINAVTAGATVTINGAQQVMCRIASDIRVGQPTDGFSSNCSLCCTDELGRVLKAHTELDVALIHVRKGLDYLDEIKGDDTALPKVLNTFVTGVHAVTGSEASSHQYAVHKRGADTLYTSGMVDSLDASGWIAEGNLDKGWRVFGRFYDHVMVVKPSGSTFHTGGDSGSPVFNDSGEIVGVLFGGSNLALVTPIDQITSGPPGLPSIKVLTATALGQKQTVSDAEGALAMVGASDELVTRQLLKAEVELSATPTGKEYVDLIRRHANEVQTLVDTNRRVATTWHRNGGPRIAQAVVSYFLEKSRRLPDELDGRSLTECLRDIQQALMRYGSGVLARDLEQYGPEILSLIDLSYSEALVRMKKQPV